MTSKTLLKSQAEVFLEWGRRNSVASLSYRYWLEMFIQDTHYTDVIDVKLEDIDLFVGKRQDIIRTKYTEQSARRALVSFLRFYMARSKNGKLRMREGRPPHISEIAKTQQYRKMGLPLKDISKLMGKNISLIHRWIKYPLDKLKDPE